MTQMQEIFAREYLVDLNATNAAIRAGYSFKTARSIGSENLTKPDIQELIGINIAARSARTEVTTDDVVRGLAAIAFSNIGDLLIIDSNGVRLRPAEEISKNALAGVKIMSLSESNFKIASFNKLKALHLLGLHIGMFKK